MQPFVIEICGLKRGENLFEWAATKQFFEEFGNSEILEADLKVEASVVGHGLSVDAQIALEGTLTVPCDRCLGALPIPVKVAFEESYVPEDGVLDLSQDIYDFACTALPLQRVHELGECDEEVTKYLKEQ